MDTQLQPVGGNVSTISMFDMMDKIERMANIMASSRSMIPKHFQGSPGDCMAVVMQSMQWGMNPYAIAQKTFLINGTLGYESQLVNAVITSLAPIKGRMQFRWEGAWEKIIGKFKSVESKTKKDDNGNPKTFIFPDWKTEDEIGLTVTVWATFKDEEEPRELTLMLTQARTRNSTLWTEDPKQQLAYLAIKRWSRLYCPDVIMGLYTPDELDQEQPGEKEINPLPKSDEKTASVLGGLNKKKPAIDEKPTITLDEFKKALAGIVDKATQAHAKELIAQMAGEERRQADTLYKRFCDQAKANATQKAKPLSDADKIKACTHQDMLNDVLQEFSAGQLEEHEPLILEIQSTFDPFL